MEEGLLSLKWNNHKSTFFHVLSILREKHTYTDVTLACEGRLYPAHKFVLSTCSEYFSDIFTSTSGNNIVIVLKDVRRQDLEYLLDYMYLGQVDVAQSELSSLIKTAECLRIKGLAIPDDEPQQTSRRGLDERDREGSPPSKKKRHLMEDDRPSSISTNNTTNRLPLVALPPQSQQQALLQRLQQAPLPQSTQAPPTSQAAGKSHPSPLPHSLTSQVPRSSQVPTSPLPPTSLSQSHPTLPSPTQSASLPVIKQEVADPPETPEVFMNENYDENETKPDVSDSRHLEQDVAIAGPSGLQGSSDNWDGDSDLAGFAGGEGYSESGLDDQGDSEVQGGRIRVKSRRELGLLTIVSTSSLSSPSTVSSSSPSATGGNSGILISPSPSHAQTPLMSPVATSPVPHGSPVTSPVTNPLSAPISLSCPLKCPYCSYIGTSESVLLRHLRTHGGSLAGVRLYHCNSCPYSATQWESVRRHSWRQHRQEIDAAKDDLE